MAGRLARTACWMAWLCCLCRLAPGGGAAAPAQPTKADLEARVRGLRKQAVAAGDAASHDVLFNLAQNLQQLNHMSPDGGRRIPEAERAYRKVLAMVAEHPRAALVVRGNLAALLLAADRTDDALTQLEAALQLAASGLVTAQEVAGVHFNKGKALATAGRLEAAEQAYAEAAAAAAGSDFGTFAKALAAMQAAPPALLDQAEQAGHAVRAALAAQPGTGFLKDALAAWPAPSPAGAADASPQAPPAWVAAASAVDASWLHFALFKQHDSAGDTDLAWACLTAANRLMAAASGPYSPAGERAGLADIQASFGARVFEGAGSGCPNASLATPIFVVGMPRSGSTLVEQLLGSHSWVWAAGEDTAMAPLVADLAKALGPRGEGGFGSAERRRLLRRQGCRYLRAMRKRVPKEVLADITAAVAGAQAASSSGGAGGASEVLLAAGDAQPVATPGLRIVDKMLRNIWLLGFIRLMVPHACVLHVVRHPLDTALSCYAQPFGYAGVSWAWDLDHIGTQIAMTAELAAHWQAALPGWVHTVRYEQLVAQPEAMAKRVLAACGLPWQPGVLRFHEAAGRRAVATASVAQVRRPLYDTSTGRWRRYARQLRPLAGQLADLVGSYEVGLAADLEAGSGGGSDAGPRDEL